MYSLERNEVLCVNKKDGVVYFKSLNNGKHYIGIHTTWQLNSPIDDALKKEYNCKTCKHKFRCVTQKPRIVNVTSPRIWIDETLINPLLCEGE